MHGWRRRHGSGASPLTRRFCLTALLISILILIAVAALRSVIGNSLAIPTEPSIYLPGWTATNWNAQTILSQIDILPHRSTFIETLLSLPLFIGWVIHNHPIWGLPVLFCAALIVLGLWRLAAHVLGTRKPAVFLPALIVLQCAALGWGWTFYSPLPYHLNTPLSVVDLKSTSKGILSPSQQTSWHQQNGFAGLVLQTSKSDDYKTLFPKMIFIDPATLQSNSGRFPANVDWWIFPQDTSLQKPFKTNWKNGKVAAVSIQNPSVNAWEKLPTASLINSIISIIALLLFAILYGMQPASAPLSAPGRVTDFLQKNRRLKRWGGLAMMLLAFVGTLLALWLTFYPAWGFERLETLPLTTTLILCVALDYCYWQGRKTWTKRH